MYKLKFIDSYRLMQNSLLSLVDNLSKINNKEAKDKKISQATLTKKFFNTYQLCDKDLNKFTLLLRKGVYLYEYIDSWEKFNVTSLKDK